MRIALLSPSFLPALGGMEFVVHSLAVEWGKQGHDVLVINWTSDRPTHPEANYAVAKFDLLRGAPRFGYHRFPFSGYSRRSIERILEDFNPDFISAHMAYPTAHWLARMHPKRRYVVTCHGSDITLFDWGFRKRYGIDAELREGLNQSVGAIAISTHAHKMIKDLGVDSQVIKDISNGVDLERFRKTVEFSLRDELGLDSSTLIILSVGRDHPQKDYSAGIRAFANVAERLDNAYYAIIGKNASNHQTLAESLGVGDRVLFPGPLQGDRMVGAYQQANVFFSPSIWEMMPLVVLESMAVGLPSVVTNISGSQDLVLDGETGFIVEPGDEEAMADALVGLLEEPEARQKFRQAALNRSEAFSWDRISRRYLELA
jgi:glycosyltransferase involved in cell wall biosynthesis